MDVELQSTSAPSAVTLDLIVAPTAARVGDSIVVLGSFSPATSLAQGRVRGEVQRPDGKTDPLVLHDDGLRPEKSWRHLDADALARSYEVNAIGPALVAKHLLPRLRRDHKAVFAAMSARVGSIEDNRIGGWYAYRASKAALNQILRTLAIELGRRWPEAVCVGLHPGTTDTALSAPFQANVPAGKLFTPTFVAERLLTVVDDLDASASGGLYAWDGARIPF